MCRLSRRKNTGREQKETGIPTKTVTYGAPFKISSMSLEYGHGSFFNSCCTKASMIQNIFQHLAFVVRHGRVSGTADELVHSSDPSRLDRQMQNQIGRVDTRRLVQKRLATQADDHTESARRGNKNRSFLDLTRPNAPRFSDSSRVLKYGTELKLTRAPHRRQGHRARQDQGRLGRRRDAAVHERPRGVLRRTMAKTRTGWRAVRSGRPRPRGWTRTWTRSKPRVGAR